jgi:hypothetical protein
MADSDFQIINSNTRVQGNLKRVYPKTLNPVYVPGTELLSSIPTDKGVAVGEGIFKEIELSLMGGFSASSIGQASDIESVQTNYKLKDFFHSIRVNEATAREAMKSEEAFEPYMKRLLSQHAPALAWHKARMLFGLGTGVLGTVSTVSSSGSTHTCVLSDYNRAKLIPGEIVELVRSGTKESALFKIIKHIPADSKVVLELVDGSSTPQASDVIKTQNAHDASLLKEWTGLGKVLPAASGSLYGVTLRDGFQALRKDASSAPVSLDLLEEAYFFQRENATEAPDGLAMSFTQAQLINRVERASIQDAIIKRSTGSGDELNINVQSIRLGNIVVPLFPTEHMPNKTSIYFINRKHMVIESNEDGRFVPVSEDGNGGIIHNMHIISKKAESQMLYNFSSELFVSPAQQLELYDLNSTL